MQTFLPYQSFTQSAQVLDNRRLGKQRVECLQLLQVLLGRRLTSERDWTQFTPKGWARHPAALMWQGFEEALALYTERVCQEWVRRGFKDTCLFKMDTLIPVRQDVVYPAWLGDEGFHASHRSNLLRKDPVWYGQFGWSEPSTLAYIWPTSQFPKT